MTEVKEPLEKLLLDATFGRYNLVALTRNWIHCLKGSEDIKGLTQAEIIRKAIEDVVTGKVTREDIIEALKNRASKNPGSANPEEKSEGHEKKGKKD